MRAKLQEARLYGIVDIGYVEAAKSADVVRAMIDGGVDIIQLRAKGSTLESLNSLAAQLHRITSVAGIPFIVNDFATVASASDAEGVHVGQDDAFISSVRAFGREFIVGKSTHSVAQAVAAQNESADYIGFGPLFATPTKPDYAAIGLDSIREVHEKVTVPIFCIGGVNLETLEQVIAAGARRVVIVSALLQAHDVADYARRAKAMLP